MTTFKSTPDQRKACIKALRDCKIPQIKYLSIKYASPRNPISPVAGCCAFGAICIGTGMERFEADEVLKIAPILIDNDDVGLSFDEIADLMEAQPAEYFR